LFGGKGRFVNFYETGDALFSIMCDIESKLNVSSFFVLDENFLLHRKRALRLLELMTSSHKSWSLYVFSSARVLRSYTIDQLVGMGISWVWMGLESKINQYRKLRNVDTYALVQDLKSHGIRVLGSSIIGLEDHTPENMNQVIEDAIRHDSDFHQFMLYTPIPGTPLYDQHRKNGTLLSETTFSMADAHGQYRFNYRHPHINQGQEEKFLLKAFLRDFEVNGPSLARLIRTLLTGWQHYKSHPDRRIRRRFNREAFSLRTTYAGAIWAMKKYYRTHRQLSEKMTSLLRDIYREFGWLPRISAPLIGRFLHFTMMKEAKRLANGWTYEPKTFCEKNPAALALGNAEYKSSTHQISKNYHPAPAFARTRLQQHT
jgi:hypothetical protein